ncbi:hypothetical protein [Rhizobium lusitanum]|uniref:hypothetical protein n=1 Tax=Rhizobium lusitanum TaxID=293958 RepID=UPI00195C4451|nr:hypothetical protein [Rhizobium lusitanum]MBM7043748.1 hypothetical protein [Rhizobium lusitanum]
MPTTLSTAWACETFITTIIWPQLLPLGEFHEASDQALPGRNQIVPAGQKNPLEAKLARDHTG